MSSIRRLKGEEILSFQALWKDVFKDEDSFISFFFAEKCLFALGLYEGDTLQAALSFTPYTLRVGSRKIKTAFLVGLVTRPQARGRGLAYALLKEAEEELKKEGIAFYLLYPAIPYPFYTKRGGLIVDERLVYDLKKEQRFFLSGAVQKVMETQDRDFLSHAFCTYNRRFAFVTHREEKDWDCRLKDLSLDQGTILRCGEAAALQVGQELKEVYGPMEDVACLCNELLVSYGQLRFPFSRLDPLYRRLDDARGALHLMPHTVLQLVSPSALCKEDREILTNMAENRPDGFIYDEY